MKTQEFFRQMTVKELRKVCVAINGGPLGFDYADRSKEQMVAYAIAAQERTGKDDSRLDVFYETAKAELLAESQAKYAGNAGDVAKPVIPAVNYPKPGPPVSESRDDQVLAIAEMLSKLTSSQSASVDEEQVRAIVKAELGMFAAPTRVELSIAGEIKPLEGIVHRQFPILLQMVSASVPVWLSGPAGSGKTTAAEMVAKALGLSFYFNGAIDNEYKLLGFTDANGKIVSRPFREAFVNGGVYLFDEIDASLPGAVLAFNAALANGHCDFPDGMFPKHPNFRPIAAANTFGLGATSDYVGRMKQDAAFVDRFAVLAWETDEALERAVSGNDVWVSYVQSARAKAKAKGIKVVISPRASIYGAKLLAAGVDRDQVIASCVRKGMTDEQWNSVRS